ncbi:unnamed protein product, partial [Amoebophrya sp. A120]|eukprot:GSA120T00025251001.1
MSEPAHLLPLADSSFCLLFRRSLSYEARDRGCAHESGDCIASLHVSLHEKQNLACYRDAVWSCLWLIDASRCCCWSAAAAQGPVTVEAGIMRETLPRAKPKSATRAQVHKRQISGTARNWTGAKSTMRYRLRNRSSEPTQQPPLRGSSVSVSDTAHQQGTQGVGGLRATHAAALLQVVQPQPSPEPGRVAHQEDAQGGVHLRLQARPSARQRANRDGGWHG